MSRAQGRNKTRVASGTPHVKTAESIPPIAGGQGLTAAEIERAAKAKAALVAFVEGRGLTVVLAIIILMLVVAMAIVGRIASTPTTGAPEPTAKTIDTRE